MIRSRSGVLSALALAVLAVGVAGCGGGSSSKEGKGGSYGSGAGASTSQTSSTKSSGPAMVTTKPNATFGPILAAGGSTLTLYMFASDHGKVSTCYGACATVWPPLLTTGKPQAAGGATAAELGTIKRSDGTTQVTYAGRPLYYYTPDKSPSDVTGQGVSSFGAFWYVMSPSGKVVKRP